MDWKNLGKQITSMGAGLLGTAVAGPGGGAALGSLVASLWGADSEDPADILSKMQMDPEAHIKLADLQNRHKERLEELAIEEGRMHLQDRQSAREREMRLAEAKQKNKIQPALAVIGVFGFLGLLGYIMGVGLADMNQQEALLVGNLMGFAGAVFKDIFAYYFGSSKGSSDKTTLLAEKK